MDEYISREEAKQFFNLHFGSVSHAVIAARLLDEIPAADVVKVVRCQDCVHHHDCGTHFCDKLGMDCPGDSEFFCKYGEMDGGIENE